MIRFGEKETCKLVELYRNHECLWNPNNEHYRNKRKSLAACEAIAREMDMEGFTAGDVKIKLKNLRGTYNQELIKIKKIIQAGETNYVSNMKWFYIMESFIKKLKNLQPSEDSTPQNVLRTPDDVFLEDSELEQSESNSENASPVENELNIRSTLDTKIITATAETPTIQSTTNPEVFTVIPEYRNTRLVSHPDIITVKPEILTVKAVSSPEFVSVTPKIKCVESLPKSEGVKLTSKVRQRAKLALNSAVSTWPSEIQTVKSASSNKRFAAMPETLVSTSASNHNYVALSPGEKKNTRCIKGHQVITLATELQPKNKQISIDGSPEIRKRRLDEVSSTNSNNEIRQINNTGSVADNAWDQSVDEMVAFGHFVALNLKKMSMQSALSAQSEILSVLTHYRLNDSAGNTTSQRMVP